MQLRPILGIVTFLAMTSCVLAQTATGVIRGTVQDPTGAHLAAAKLTVTSVDTQASKVVETSDTGDYSVPYLINGTYTVKAEHAGFRPALTSNVVVRAAETVRVDFRMHLSEVQQVIDVSGTASALQTDTTAVGTTIDSTSVRELPLNGRTFAQLAALVPGVAPQSSVNIATDRKRGSIGTSYAITANGFSDVQNSFVYDGVPAMDLDSYNFAFSPSIDAIAEFRVQTNSYSGAYGGAPGAHVDVVTKSGTNAFHGTLWEFNRNDALAARNYFSTTKARLNRNQTETGRTPTRRNTSQPLNRRAGSRKPEENNGEKIQETKERKIKAGQQHSIRRQQQTEDRQKRVRGRTFQAAS